MLVITSCGLSARLSQGPASSSGKPCLEKPGNAGHRRMLCRLIQSQFKAGLMRIGRIPRSNVALTHYILYVRYSRLIVSAYGRAHFRARKLIGLAMPNPPHGADELLEYTFTMSPVRPAGFPTHALKRRDSNSGDPAADGYANRLTNPRLFANARPSMGQTTIYDKFTSWSCRSGYNP